MLLFLSIERNRNPTPQYARVFNEFNVNYNIQLITIDIINDII